MSHNHPSWLLSAVILVAVSCALRFAWQQLLGTAESSLSPSHHHRGEVWRGPSALVRALWCTIVVVFQGVFESCPAAVLQRVH